MASKEKFNFNEAFISKYEKRRICGIYGIVNTNIGMLGKDF